MKKNILFLLLILMVAILVRAPGLSEPFECDQANYGYVAMNWEQGRLPYHDLWDNKPPMIYLFYRLIYRSLGYSDLFVHFGFMMLAVLTVFVFYLLSRKFLEASFALLSTLLYAIFSSGALISGTFAVTENLMVFFTILSLYLFFTAYQKSSKLLFFISGIAMGFALMTKQVALWEALAVSVFLILPVIRKNRAIDNVIRLVLFWFGVILILFTCFLYFKIKGAGHDFVNAIFFYNLFFGRIVGLRQGFTNFINALSWSPMENFYLWLLAILGFLKILFGRDKSTVFLALWFIAAAIGVASSLRFYPHYFIQSIPVLSILCIFYLKQFIDSSRSRWAGVLACLTIVLICGIFMIVQLPFYLARNPVQSLVAKRSGLVRPQMQRSLPEVVRFIRRNTTLQDKIYVWGLWPEIYFYSGRQTASKYFYISGRGTLLGKFKEELDKQVLFDIIKNKPKYFIIDPHYSDMISQSLGRYLAKHYSFERRIAGCKLLRRND